MSNCMLVVVLAHTYIVLGDVGDNLNVVHSTESKYKTALFCTHTLSLVCYDNCRYMQAGLQGCHINKYIKHKQIYAKV